MDPPRFVCDGSLGGLARWLRAAGYEARWLRVAKGSGTLSASASTGEVALVSDRRLMARRVIRDGRVRALLVPTTVTRLEQLEHVLLELGLALRPPRCMDCGGALEAVAKSDVQERIPPRTALWKDDYVVCRGCDKLYWRGTHWERIRARLAGLRAGEG
jgi:uncharacterized protein